MLMEVSHGEDWLFPKIETKLQVSSLQTKDDPTSAGTKFRANTSLLDDVYLMPSIPNSE
jgi:hypothetical protein